MPVNLRDTIACGLGLILGCWITYLAPAMGSTELVTSIVVTMGVIGIVLWDFRKATRPQRKNRLSR